MAAAVWILRDALKHSVSVSLKNHPHQHGQTLCVFALTSWCPLAASAGAPKKVSAIALGPAARASGRKANTSDMDISISTPLSPPNAQRRLAVEQKGMRRITNVDPGDEQRLYKGIFIFVCLDVIVEGYGVL